MKKLFVAILLAAMPLSGMAEGKVGVGIALGTPTGITGKYWLDAQAAMDVAAEWHNTDKDEFYIHSNYLIHQPTQNQPKEIQGRLSYYYGVGGYYHDRENKNGKQEDVVALRMPVGLSLQTVKVPLELFGEIVPVLEVSPDSDFGLDAGLGVRYLF